jgi:Fe-S-cluster containining protein
MAGGPEVGRRTLDILCAEIDSRSREIIREHGNWPCRRGCDECCRRLAAVPALCESEWRAVRSAYLSLPRDTREMIRRRIGELEGRDAPLTCPFLDGAAGTCLIYAARPIACRTYGFYVERDRGLYCGRILTMVDHGECETVVWGNQAAVDARLASGCGPERDLVTWFRGGGRPLR